MTRDALVEAEAAIRGDRARATVVPDVTVESSRSAAATGRWRSWSGRAGSSATRSRIAGELGFELHDAATGGASDANTTAGMGVPTIDGLGPIGGLDHSPGEYLEVASIVPRTVLLAALIAAIGRDPEVRALAGRAPAAPAGARPR